MSKKNCPLIMGIDPGYDRLGWSVGKKNSSGWEKVKHGCIFTDKNLDLNQRYQKIILELNKIIKKEKPVEAAVESLFFFKNHKTALKVAEARGIILSCLLNNNLKVYDYTPLQIKQAVTGWGRSDKKGVAKMVEMELKINSQKIIDDAIDALATMICHQANRKLINI
jgi:crossover junction endodeoxyribonuclease RuvC